MLWLAKKLKVDDRKLTLAKFKCANQVRHLMKDKRSIAALDAAERYGNGEISRDELNAAYAAAYAAASDAVTAYAAYAAADAVTAYAAASDAAADAAYAAYAAASDAAADAVTAYAAYAAADAAATRKESLRKSADFCREILTDEILIAYAKIR
jgi:hypothetical protein